MSENNNPKVAYIAAILCIVFVVFVFVFPGLREDPFVQGITGLAVTLTIAVILFSAVPSSAAIKVPIALGGAAAFFFVILPRVEPFVFPTHTITGTIYYVGTTQPVPGISIRNPDTSSSVKTDDNGDFRLPSVARSVKKLIAKSGGADYPFELNPEKAYAIIKQFSEDPKTQPQSITTSTWTEVQRHNCPVENRNEYSSVKLFLLTVDRLARAEGYNKLYLRALVPGNTTILHAELRKLPPELVHEVNDDEPNARQWWLAANDNELRFEIAVCVGAKKGVSPATPNNLSAQYWFEKESK